MYIDARLKAITEETKTSDHIKVLLAGNSSIIFSSNSSLYFFSGILADIRLFPKLLTQAEIEDVRIGVWRGATYSVIIDKISKTKSAPNVMQNFTYKEFLQPLPNTTVLSFYEGLSYPDSMRICNIYGGTLPKRDMEDDNSIVKNCNPQNAHSIDFWVHNPEYDRHNPNNTTCLIITYQILGKISLMPWQCDYIGNLVCCYVPRNMQVKMIGDPFYENSLFIVQPLSDKKNLMLVGVTNLQVKWENSSTVKVETKKGQILFTQQPITNHFMGRSTWTISQGGMINLSFSTCQTGQFSCSNGECIPLTRRCDGVPADCSDNSDDDDTCWIFPGTHHYYYSRNPPSNSRINVTLLVTHIRNVKTDSNNIEASQPWLSDGPFCAR